MIKRCLFVFCTALLFVGQVQAEKYYWVNDGGKWTEVDQHWATTSGGSIMHANLPGNGDTVFFDENSFSQPGELVSFDTTITEVAAMIWNDVINDPEFYSDASDTLIINQALLLDTHMVFSHSGALIFKSALAPDMEFETVGKTIKADVKIDIPGGEISLSSGLDMPDNNLLLLDGTLDGNNQDLVFEEINAYNGVPVIVSGSTVLTNVNRMVSYRSVFLDENMDVASLEADLLISLQSFDSSFVSFGDNKPDINISLSGNKKLFLKGPLKTSGNIEAKFSGSFYSDSYAVECDSFKSNTSLLRTIDLAYSTVQLHHFEAESSGLTLNSSNAELIYTGPGSHLFLLEGASSDFSKLTVADNNELFVQSDIHSDSLILFPGSGLALMQGVVIDAGGILAQGNCGEYITIRSYCEENPYAWPEEEDDCFLTFPVIESVDPVDADYLKVGFVKAQGAAFNADNSYEQGPAEGWTFSQAFTADTLYWVGHSGYWHDASNWSLNSGGAPQACIPHPETHVVFDQNSFNPDDTLRLTREAYSNGMIWESITGTVVWEGDADLNIGKGMQLHADLLSNFTGDIFFEASQPGDTFDIRTEGVSLSSSFIFEGNSYWQFIDDLTTTKDIVINKGSLVGNSKNIFCAHFISDSSTIRDISLKKANITLAGGGDAWRFNPSNLTMHADSSVIVLQADSADLQVFAGGSQHYFDLLVHTPNAVIRDSNVFRLLSLQPGNSLVLEPNSVTQVDSLEAMGTCDQPIQIGTGDASETAEIAKNGYKDLQVSSVMLSNIIADNTGGYSYEAVSSTASGDVSGWTFSADIPPKTYYWLGNTSHWSDLANWEQGGMPASCLPSIKDTVIIESSHMAGDTILIDQLSSCAYLDVSDSSLDTVNFILRNSLVTELGMALNHKVKMNYQHEISITETLDQDVGVKVRPDGRNAHVAANGAEINTYLFSNPYQVDDTVFLDTTLDIHGLAGLDIMSGCFYSGGHAISADVFRTTSESNKMVNIEHSPVDVKYYFIAQDNPVLDLQADSSVLSIKNKEYARIYFQGGDQTYYDFIIHLREDIDEVSDFSLVCDGSNKFHRFVVNPGGTVQFTAGSVQTVDSSLSIKGTCVDPIRFESSVEGSVYSFVKNNTTPDTAYALMVSDMDITAPSPVALLSTDEGNNSGWTFDPTKAVTAGFSTPSPVCLDDNLLFSNSSNSEMWGGENNLVYEWEVVNYDDTVVVKDLNYTFTNQGAYEIRLTAKDTVTNCLDVHADTIELVSHISEITADPHGLSVCQDELVRFEAGSDYEVDYHYYLNDVALNLGDTVDVYETDSLVDGDEVYVEANLNGCPEYSDTLSANVKPLPVAGVAVSPVDTAICEGETVRFDASGADMYRFYVNGNSMGNMSYDSVFSSSVMEDSSFIRVEASDTATGCLAWSDDEFLVRVFENPVVSLASDIDPAVICEGEQLGFTASGTENYEFFINGVSQGPADTDSVFYSDTLEDGDLVTASGINQYGCQTLSSFVNVTVNPSPDLSLVCEDADTSICEGESIAFSGSGAAEYLLVIDGMAQGGYDGNDYFVLDTLRHQQQIGMLGRIDDCYDTASVMEVNVYPDIQLQYSANEICAGDSVHFLAKGDTVYRFFVDGVATGPLSYDSTFVSDTFTDGQVITVEGTPNACTPDPMELKVNPLPVPKLSCQDADTSICQGEEISFTASQADTFEYFVNGVSQGTPGTSASFSGSTFNDRDTITMSALSVAGCFANAADTFVIDVRPVPSVSLNTNDPLTLCEGDEVTLDVAGADFYEFFKNGISIAASVSADSFNLNTLQNTDKITVEGTKNACTAKAPETLEYTVYDIPVVSIEPLGQVSVCDGDTIALLASGAVYYDFFINGVSQGPQDTNNLFVSDQLNDQDLISVAGSRNGCYDTSDIAVEVDVNDIPDVVLTTNQTAKGICLDDTLAFNVSGAREFEFFIDGVSQGVPDSLSRLELTDFVDGQVVRAYGYNNACMREADTTHKVNLNRVDLTLETDASATGFCGSEEVKMKAKGADEYQFWLDGVKAKEWSEDSILHFTANATRHTVVVKGLDTANLCIEASPEFALSQVEIPEITADKDVFCQHDSLVLASSESHNNQWLLDGVMIAGADDSEFIAHKGGAYSVAFTKGSDEAIYSAGMNGYGQLGTGNLVQAEKAVKTEIEVPMIDIKAGARFVIALDENRDVYAWGNNDYGNLGTGSYSHVYSPQKLAGVTDVKAIAAGYYHSLAVLDDSTVASWGRNNDGQLGYGNFSASNFPGAVNGLDSIQEIAAGESHSLALDVQGHVYAWGKNHLGQLGTGDLLTRNEPVRISGLNNICLIECGANHSIAVDCEGRLYVWGANGNGQLGTGDTENRSMPMQLLEYPGITKVAGGKQHSLFYNENGMLYATGSNAYGQLGVQGLVAVTRPVRVDLTGISVLEAGPSSSYAVKTDQTLWSWGQNASYQLMQGDKNNPEIPVKAGDMSGLHDIAAGQDFATAIWQEGLTCQSAPVNIEMLNVPEVEIKQDDLDYYVEEGQQWQWLLNGQEIPGATGSRYTVSTDGDYGVLVDFANGCSYQTDEIAFASNINLVNHPEANISIYPNPSNGRFSLIFDVDKSVLNAIQGWKIFSASGRMIREMSHFQARPQQNIDIRGAKPGVYYLKLKGEMHFTMIPFVVK